MTGVPDRPRGLDGERAEANLRRARVMLPIMLPVHVACAVAFTQVPAADAGEAAWRAGLITIHAAAAAFVLAVWLVAVRGVGGRLVAAARGALGELVTAYPLTVGTAASLNTLHHNFGITAWIIGVVLSAIAVYARFVPALVLFAGAAAAMLAGGLGAAGDAGDHARLAANVVVMGGVAFLLSRLLHASFAREVAARHAVGALNLELERRVAAQVGEIVTHAERIEALNRQLADQVQARSAELSAALQRLAAVQHGEDALRPGAVVAERFEIRHLLGVGGMGVVYAAHDRVARADVAVKLVHGNVAGVEAAYRFLQEAAAAAQLVHPAIVRVLHVDVTSDGRLYQAQELVDGRPLDTWTDLGRTLPAPVVARLGAVLADALATAHAAGIVHRDVKPQNVMLTAAAPGCRLLDFGLAKLRRTLVDSTLTEAGTVVGTPQFLSPEQIATPADVDGAADVYALGVVLYLCAAGRFPWEAEAPMQWLHAHTHVEPAPLPVAAAPAPLGAAIMRCLAKAPAARPTAAELAATLTALATDLRAEALEAFSAREERGATRPLRRPSAA